MAPQVDVALLAVFFVMETALTTQCPLTRPMLSAHWTWMSTVFAVVAPLYIASLLLRVWLHAQDNVIFGDWRRDNVFLVSIMLCYVLFLGCVVIGFGCVPVIVSSRGGDVSDWIVFAVDGSAIVIAAMLPVPNCLRYDTRTHVFVSGAVGAVGSCTATYNRTTQAWDHEEMTAGGGTNTSMSIVQDGVVRSLPPTSGAYLHGESVSRPHQHMLRNVFAVRAVFLTLQGVVLVVTSMRAR